MLSLHPPRQKAIPACRNFSIQVTSKCAAASTAHSCPALSRPTAAMPHLSPFEPLRHRPTRRFVSQGRDPEMVGVNPLDSAQPLIHNHHRGADVENVSESSQVSQVPLDGATACCQDCCVDLGSVGSSGPGCEVLRLGHIEHNLRGRFGASQPGFAPGSANPRAPFMADSARSAPSAMAAYSH